MKPLIAVPATAALVYRAWSRKSLTPFGIAVAAATAIAHAIHPWSIFFALLCVFFLSGTAVTKVKHEVKARLTQSASGASGGEGPRNHLQVLANSVVASVLILAHAYQLKFKPEDAGVWGSDEKCWWRSSDVYVVGIIANYAAVTADTFSSELGILSSSPPRLITAPWRKVPRGTNGGVTYAGLLAGLLGSGIIAVTSVILLPFCPINGPPKFSWKLIKYGKLDDAGWPPLSKLQFILGITALGFCGTLLDSLLGALVQASVVDSHTGKVIEGAGGRKVLVHGSGHPVQTIHAEVRGKLGRGEGKTSVAKTSALSDDTDTPTNRTQSAEQSDPLQAKQDSRRIEVGVDLLDNNGVNLLMAATISVASMMITTWLWDLPKKIIDNRIH